jgi:hypothetical protein
MQSSEEWPAAQAGHETEVCIKRILYAKEKKRKFTQTLVERENARKLLERAQLSLWTAAQVLHSPSCNTHLSFNFFMGTALTPAERTVWYDFLKDLDGTRRTRFADLLAAAPADAAHAAYTLNDFEVLDSLEDVEASLKDVSGFRIADVKLFLQYWKTHSGDMDVSNRPVLATAAMAATSAAIARGDAPGVAAEAVAKALARSRSSQEDIEGNSVFCSAAFKLKIESSKLGKVAALGVDPEEADYVLSEKGFEINTSEYKSHLDSIEEWMEYTRDVKGNCREFDRDGLVLRITGFNDRLYRMRNWRVAREYIMIYFRRKKCRLPVEYDSDIYLEALQKVMGSAPSSGGPSPAALTPPAGAAAAPTPRAEEAKMVPGPATVDGWGAQLESLQTQFGELMQWIQGSAQSGETDLPPPPLRPASDAEERAAAQKAKRKESWDRLKAKWAEKKAERKAAAKTAPSSSTSRLTPDARTPDDKTGPATDGLRYVSPEEWDSLSPAEQGQIRKARQAAQKDGGAASGSDQARKKKRGRSPGAAGTAAPPARGLPATPPETPPATAAATDGSSPLPTVVEEEEELHQ